MYELERRSNGWTVHLEDSFRPGKYDHVYDGTFEGQSSPAKCQLPRAWLYAYCVCVRVCGCVCWGGSRHARGAGVKKTNTQQP